MTSSEDIAAWSPPSPGAFTKTKAAKPRGNGGSRPGTKGRGRAVKEEDTHAPKASENENQPRRTELLRIRMSDAELKRLPNGTCRSRWARDVLLQVAAGRLRVGPDADTLRHANCLSAWLGALITQVGQKDATALDRAEALVAASDILERRSSIVDEGSHYAG